MPTACITGASSGIGKEFARKLSHLNYDLILIARSTDALNTLASHLKTKCEIINCDLSDEKQCLKLSQDLASRDIRILINNAGFGDLGSFSDTSLTKELDMINVNIKALHILTKALLPGFIQRDRSFILNVASSAGLLCGGPYMATYYATKAYVTSLTSGIYEELRALNSRVHISMLCPGPVETNFNNVANAKFSLKGISASYCASYALRQMFHGKLTIVPSFTMKAAVYGSRFLPRTALLKITGNQQTKKLD
jgi:short-subunit dehydrogenase